MQTDQQVDPCNKKTCYLLHHSVKHVNKPVKIRIVFDCSAYYGETSLNNGLLSGPDLSNQLSGGTDRILH